MSRVTFKAMTKLELITGFPEDEPIILDIAPTMKSITHGGKRYHRVDNCYRVLYDEDSKCATYLWDGFARELMRRKEAEAAK